MRDPRLIVVLVVLFTAGIIAYLGTRGGAQPVGDTDPTPPALLAYTPPIDEPIPPLGPHREVFQASCTICHSTRLIMTQPQLNEGQWKGVVEKMVKMYGAPLHEEQQRLIVAYLASIGAEPRQLAAK